MVIHCPYCMSYDIDWSSFTDSVMWASVDAGEIVTKGLRCPDPNCKGHAGFTARAPFSVDYGCTEYYTKEGDEIEEASE